MDDKKIIELLKSGMTQREIASLYHVQTFTISQICKGFPTNKCIEKIKNTKGFREWFIENYNKNDIKSFLLLCRKHPFFKRVENKSIYQRVCEIRKLFDLSPKMPERSYLNKYDRIRGYIIRNTKYMAKRRNIHFDLNYTDFELPEKCPILEILLEYGSGKNGNSPNHATLDRIDNSKGYVKGNVMIISRLANAMKNSANFDNLQHFIKNYTILLNNINKQGTLGNITDIFPHWKKLSLDS